MATCLLFIFGLLLMLTLAFILSKYDKIWERLIIKRTAAYWYLSVAISVALLFIVPDMPHLHHLQKLGIMGSYAIVCVSICAIASNISYLRGGYHKIFTAGSLIAGVLHMYLLLVSVLFFGFGIG